MRGSGYRVPPSLVRRSDGQTLQLTPLLYAILDAVDGERTPAEIAERATRQVGRLVQAEDVVAPDRLVAAAARPPHQARRIRARGQALRPAARAPAAQGDHEPGRHAARDRPVRPAVQPVRRHPRGLSLPRRVLVASDGGGPRRGDVSRVPGSGRAAPHRRRHRAVGRLPRVRPRRRRTVRRCHAGTDGDGAVPALARVLHRRDRLLPSGACRAHPHRPRRTVLQRHRRRRRSSASGGAPTTTPSSWSSSPSCCRWCTSSSRWSASTGTTCWPTSPACRTSSSASAPRSPGSFPGAGGGPSRASSSRGREPSSAPGCSSWSPCSSSR